MIVAILNGVITIALLAGMIYGARWIYLTGVKDGRYEMKAEMRLEAIQASNAKLQQEASQFAEKL